MKKAAAAVAAADNYFKFFDPNHFLMPYLQQAGPMTNLLTFTNPLTFTHPLALH
ncbi:MAG: hypothetical protein IPP71_03980 [Bacteroidetes bacterium]|nr:hypothetical protein [Bacteroidota bacterium]